MKRYIALLRGVNISGKNRVPMPELKAGLAELGYGDVCTYLNSGNVVFTAPEAAGTVLAEQIRALIRAAFGLEIPVLVLAQQELQALLEQAPAWWGTPGAETYHNLIFVLPGACAGSIAETIGPPTEGLERIRLCGNAIFWSFDRKRYARANWWKKTAGAGVGELLTIRTANPLKKIAGM